MHPTTVGWLSVSDAENMKEFNLSSTANQFESGGRPIISLVGMDAGLTTLEKMGWETISKTTLARAEALSEGLINLNIPLVMEYTDDNRSGIVTIREGEHTQQIKDVLEQYQVVSTFRDNMLRLSPYYIHSSDDIDVVLDVIRGCVN